jgi:hypothetical protein
MLFLYFIVDLIYDKENFIELKNYYDKMIIYEFELNGREENFFEDLKQVTILKIICFLVIVYFFYIFKLFEIIEVLEIKKGKIISKIKQ